MEEKKKHKVVIELEVVLLCMIIAIVGTNAASSNPPSSGVSYSKNSQTTVEGALNDLYTKANYGNASAAQILKGKTALVKGKQVTGTYEEPSLESLTPGDATAENIDEGKIAWVNGKKVVGATRKLAEKLNLGDYIRYKSSSTSYTISKSDTGDTSDKTINPSELDLWRVIRLKSDGTVEIVSEKTSSEWVYFKGTTAYTNYIGTLNKIAKSYENSVYTAGSRHMGYNSLKENEVSSSQGEGYILDAGLVEAAIGTLRAECSGVHKTGYYLASREIVNPGSSNSITAARTIHQSGSLMGATLNDSNSPGECIRPIVVLKSTLKLTGGAGTSSSPYTLGV